MSSFVEPSSGHLFMKKLPKYAFRHTMTFHYKSNSRVRRSILSQISIQTIIVRFLRKLRLCLAKAQFRPHLLLPHVTILLIPTRALAANTRTINKTTMLPSTRLRCSYTRRLRQVLKGRDTNARASLPLPIARNRYQFKLPPKNFVTLSMIRLT